VPYLTPPDLPESDDCRSLLIPASSDWLALFGGALTELTKTWNWEDSGGLTVAETVAKMNEIIDAWYNDPCAVCETPGGFRVIRINGDGELEQLNDVGDWEAATDEYYIPPPEARTGGEPEDQICLAAKNAVNVLEQLYESLSESWAEELSEAEALTAFIGVLVGVVGFAFAPITAAIYAFFRAVFSLLYLALEYLGADLWDESVSDQITCFLVECASNDSGVVTFDWDCFTGQLNSLADSFGLSEVQIRLYLQITYMLYFIGGVDGLNLAARTTEITDDDCPCECEVELYSAAYGTVESLGGTRWRLTGGWTGSNYSLVVGAVGGACWCYDNIDFVTGSLTYSDYTVCSGGAPIVGMPNSCCGSESGTMRDDLVAWFLQHTSVPWVIELDAHCKEECP